MKTKSIGKKLYAAVFLCMLAVTACTNMLHEGFRKTPDNPVPQPDFLQVAPLRSVYSRGDSFTPAAGIEVYRSTAEGTWETVPPSSWTSVTITPDGGTPAVVSGSFTFTSLEGHTVEVKALGMDAACDLWVLEAGNRPAISIVYTSGAGGRMEQNAGGSWEVTTPVWNEVIYSFTTVNYEAGGSPGRTYLMGRKDNDTTPLKLNISPAGELAFRGQDPAHNNLIPVGTVAEMQMINTVTGALAGKYCQEADIDLLGDFTGPLAKYTWKPIGKAPLPNTKDTPFTGVFDGGGKLLTHISVNESSDGAGLFGYLNGSAVLRNIRLASGTVIGGDDVGGIAGGQAQDNQSIKILNSSNEANITGVNAVGGIIGWPQNGAVIAGCRNSGDVSGAVIVGGIDGGGDHNYTVTACYNTGDVSGNNEAGGIAGGNGAGSTIACYNHGSVTGNQSIFGVLGNGWSPVTASYWNNDPTIGTQATKGRYTWENYTVVGSNDGAEPYDGSANFPNVQGTHPEWGPGAGPADWDGTGTPPAGGWWKQTTLGGGDLPKLWWE